MGALSIGETGAGGWSIRAPPEPVMAIGPPAADRDQRFGLAFFAFLAVLPFIGVFAFAGVLGFFVAFFVGFGLDATAGVTSSCGRPRRTPRVTFQGFPQ